MEKLKLTVKVFLPFNNVLAQDPVKLALVFGYDQWFLASDGVSLCAAIVRGDDSSPLLEYFPLSFLNYRILEDVDDNSVSKKRLCVRERVDRNYKNVNKKG